MEQNLRKFSKVLKRTTALFLAVILLIAFVGCGENNSTTFDGIGYSNGNQSFEKRVERIIDDYVFDSTRGLFWTYTIENFQEIKIENKPTGMYVFKLKFVRDSSIDVLDDDSHPKEDVSYYRLNGFEYGEYRIKNLTEGEYNRYINME